MHTHVKVLLTSLVVLLTVACAGQTMEIPATTTATLQPPTATSQSLTPIAETVTPTVEPTPTPEETLRIDIIQINQEVEELGWQAVEVIDDESMLVPNAAALENESGEVEWYVLVSETGLVVYPKSDGQAVEDLEATEGKSWEEWREGVGNQLRKNISEDDIYIRTVYYPFVGSPLLSTKSDREVWENIAQVTSIRLIAGTPLSGLSEDKFKAIKNNPELQQYIQFLLSVFKKHGVDYDSSRRQLGLGTVTAVYEVNIERTMENGSVLHMKIPAWEEVAYDFRSRDFILRMVFPASSNIQIQDESITETTSTLGIQQAPYSEWLKYPRDQDIDYLFSGSANLAQATPAFIWTHVQPGSFVLTGAAEAHENCRTFTNPNAAVPAGTLAEGRYTFAMTLDAINTIRASLSSLEEYQYPSRLSYLGLLLALQ